MADKKVNLIISLKDGVSSALGRIRTGLGHVRSAFKAMAKGAVVAGAALAGVVWEGAKFNIEMARVWTMAGGGVTAFRKLREEARGLAADFGLARSEVATGMYNALSAGIDASGLKSFMSVAAKVAVADGSNISVAVDGITTVLNAFKIKSSETEAVTDQLFKTVAMGKTTFQELARSLFNVAGVAAASNIPLEQILAHVAALTAQGTPTAQATTQIRMAIIGLNKALGDGWSESMSFQQGLKEVWSQAGQSQTALLKLVGSTEAMMAVLGGVGQNAKMAAEKLYGMKSAAGAAEAAFQKVDQFRHWPHLLESARGALSKFGEMVDKRIKPYVDKVTDAIKKWTSDSDLWANIEKMLGVAEAKLQAIGEVVSGIIKAVSAGNGKEVWGALGDVIRAAFWDAADLAGEILLDYAPRVGKEIAKGIIDLLNPHMFKWLGKEGKKSLGTPQEVDGSKEYEKAQRISEKNLLDILMKHQPKKASFYKEEAKSGMLTKEWMEREVAKLALANKDVAKSLFGVRNEYKGGANLRTSLASLNTVAGVGTKTDAPASASISVAAKSEQQVKDEKRAAAARRISLLALSDSSGVDWGGEKPSLGGAYLSANSKRIGSGADYMGDRTKAISGKIGAGGYPISASLDIPKADSAKSPMDALVETNTLLKEQNKILTDRLGGVSGGD